MIAHILFSVFFLEGGVLKRLLRRLTCQISFNRCHNPACYRPHQSFNQPLLLAMATFSQRCFELGKCSVKLMKTVLFWTILWLWCSTSAILNICTVCLSCALQCSAFWERAGQGFGAGWRYVSVTLHGGGQWGHKIGEEYPRQEYPRSNIPKMGTQNRGGISQAGIS